MSRKKFIESHGASCDNWRDTWSFVNHDEKFIIFGTWDTNYLNDGSCLILSQEWEFREGKKQAAYRRSLEHCDLIMNHNYQLMTFDMKYASKLDKNGKEIPVIESFSRHLVPKSLRHEAGEFFAESEISEDRVARICWNTHNWKKPSGYRGKSKHSDSFEMNNGYGHEEWLLDTTKVINGYHYAFIQNVFKKNDNEYKNIYVGRVFNLSLYTINAETKQRWWIGRIKNVIVINKGESRQIHKFYCENGWLDEMLSQLENVGVCKEDFKAAVSPDYFSTIKFRLEDLDLLGQPLEFSADDEMVPSNHYNLLNSIGTPKLFSNQTFSFVPGHNEGASKKSTCYERIESETDLVHNKIQSDLYKQLGEIYGLDNVGTEIKTKNNTKIDLVIKSGVSYIFFEIKTSNTPRSCLREAIGQLLEYAYFGEIINVEKFIVVGTLPPNNESEAYLNYISNTFNLNIKYIQFSLETNSLLSTNFN